MEILDSLTPREWQRETVQIIFKGEIQAHARFTVVDIPLEPGTRSEESPSTRRNWPWLN